MTSYYDKGSGNTYTPVSNGTAVGTSYLGSEHDYIIKSGVPEYLFGKSGATFYEADLVSYAYAFKLTYGDGDYYTGTVYAAPEYGYSAGYTKTTTDEKGQTDTYTITGVTAGYNVSKAGQVYVTSYYDKGSGKTYTPVSNGTAVGTSYLGSEHDYIIKSGVSEYLFGHGGSFHEADLTSYAYAFKFTYGDGDYYTGTVYAAPEYGYSTGYTQTTTDEKGQTDTYTITGVTTGQDASKAGQVYVTSYYDAGSGNTYTPVDSGTAVGTSYLGSEHDYIIQSGVPEYLFGSSGGTFYEADLVADPVAYAYAFKFTYGDGDYYTGTVYAAPEYGYSTSYTKSTTDEKGNTDTYTITGVTTGYDVSKAGQVYVASYYDAGSGKTYTPVDSGTAVGTSYLGSEHDYIIKSGVSYYLFGSSGGNFYEADLISYYVDNIYGNDANDGLSTSTAWKTINKVNNSSFNPGDSILFERGEVWREQLTVPSSGSSGYPITFSTYGTGAAPEVLGSINKDTAGDWTHDTSNGDPNLWYSTASSTPKIVWRDGTKMTKVTNKTDLDDVTEWWWDSANSRVYVYSGSYDPTVAGHTFEIAQRANGINGGTNIDYITIDEIDVLYTNGWGIDANTGRDYWTVQNCNVQQTWYAGIHFNGVTGAQAIGNTVSHTGLVGTGTTDVQSGIILDTVTTGLVQSNTVSHTQRTGIGVISTCSNVTVEYNDVSYTGESGDHGYGIQLYPGSGQKNTGSIVRYNNLHDNGNIDIYILNKVTNAQIYYNVCNNPKGNAKGSDWFGNIVFDNTTGATGDTCTGLTVYNNVFYLDSSDKDANNVYVNYVAGVYPTKIEGSIWENNIFYNGESGQYGYRCLATHTTPPTLNYNCWYINNSNVALYENANKTWAQLRSAGQEAKGINADPVWVTAGTDFHLKSNSPCINAGVDVGLTQDYYGNSVPQESAPDIGAAE